MHLHNNTQFNSSSKRGFTLVEILITMFIMSLIMTMALGTLVGFQRSMKGLGNYSLMNMQSVKTLELFGRDARMGLDIINASDTVLEFTRATISGPDTVLYEYDSSKGILTRTYNGATQELLTDISDMKFNYFNILDALTVHPLEIKEVQIDAIMRKSVQGVENSDHIVSARFVMRNRKVAE